jgi:hypothetical protein
MLRLGNCWTFVPTFSPTWDTKVGYFHGLINYHRSKMSSGVYQRLWTGDTVSHVGMFLCELNASLTFSLVHLSHTSPLPCVNKYIVYMYKMGGGGYGFWASDR